MSDTKKVLDMIKEQNVQFIDARFTDLKGKTQHFTQHVSTIDEETLKEGFMIDGSSIQGWKTIDQSDMQIQFDVSTAVMDPFAAQPQLNIFCNVIDPETMKNYERDPRSIALAAEKYALSIGIADTIYFGPEAEFFVFDSVRFQNTPYHSLVHLDSEELPSNSAREYPEGNMGHRPKMKGGYFPTNPVDGGQDYRGEMISVLAQMGVQVEKHHHEVASAQHELGIKFNTLVKCADDMQNYKYVVHNVAHAYGKTATFMPKPVFGDNGSGMHCHQSLWKNGKPVFAGDQYAGLSNECLYYIGGIIKHAKSLNAFTNPTTNSYKRLVPGYEAPVLLAYSSRNRSASCRIPYTHNPKAKRVEVRFPDPLANPYLAFSAMLMAGLDGIANKIHPGEAMDKDLYHLPKDELAQIPTVCGSLREALEALAADNDYLTQGGVFDKGMIDAYIELKMEELLRYEMTPHPIEFEESYSG